MTNSARRTDPYANIGDLYDLEHADFADDTGLYRSLVAVTGGPVLELGCGSGRLVTALATDGFRVTGLDQSTAMLKRAETASRGLGVAHLVNFHLGDMSDADQAPGGPFGMVIVSLNGLLHVADRRRQQAVLRAAKAALDPRGQLLIDVLNPTPEFLQSLDRSLGHEGTWLDKVGSRIDKFAVRHVSPADQMIATELWYDITNSAGEVRRVHTSFPMRYVHCAELELMLESVGFAEWQTYGSYDLDPFDDHSDRLIVAAEVTASQPAPAKRSGRRG